MPEIGDEVIVTYGLEDYPAQVLQTNIVSRGKPAVRVEIDFDHEHGPDCPHYDLHSTMVTVVPVDELRPERRPFGWWLGPRLRAQR